MASLDEELLRDAEEEAREIAYVRQYIPSELNERLNDDEIRFMLEAILDYYFTSGILESDADEVEIDLEVVADHICKQAAEQGFGPYDAADMLFVAQADLEFQEQQL